MNNKMREQFEAWAKTEGLIQESFGVRSVSSMCDVAYKAWQAALSSQENVAKYELPLLPEPMSLSEINHSGGFGFTDYDMYEYAKAAIKADRARVSQTAMPNSYVACSIRGGQCKCPTACQIDMESMGPRPVIVTVKG